MSDPCDPCCQVGYPRSAGGAGSKLDEMNFSTSRLGVTGAGVQDIAIVSDLDAVPLTGIEVFLEAQENNPEANVIGSMGKFSPSYAPLYTNGQWVHRELGLIFPGAPEYADTIIMEVRTAPTVLYEIIASFIAPTTLRLTWLVGGGGAPDVVVAATVRGYRP